MIDEIKMNPSHELKFGTFKTNNSIHKHQSIPEWTIPLQIF